MCDNYFIDLKKKNKNTPRHLKDITCFPLEEGVTLNNVGMKYITERLIYYILLLYIFDIRIQVNVKIIQRKKQPTVTSTKSSKKMLNLINYNCLLKNLNVSSEWKIDSRLLFRRRTNDNSGARPLCSLALSVRSIYILIKLCYIYYHHRRNQYSIIKIRAGFFATDVSFYLAIPKWKQFKIENSFKIMCKNIKLNDKILINKLLLYSTIIK